MHLRRGHVDGVVLADDRVHPEWVLVRRLLARRRVELADTDDDLLVEVESLHQALVLRRRYLLVEHQDQDPVQSVSVIIKWRHLYILFMAPGIKIIVQIALTLERNLH